jgi:hypothetical protein
LQVIDEKAISYSQYKGSALVDIVLKDIPKVRETSHRALSLLFVVCLFYVCCCLFHRHRLFGVRRSSVQSVCFFFFFLFHSFFPLVSHLLFTSWPHASPLHTLVCLFVCLLVLICCAQVAAEIAAPMARINSISMVSRGGGETGHSRLAAEVSEIINMIPVR